MSNTLSPSIEDYLEVIFELSTLQEEVRVTDIANRLNIAKASVTEALRNLNDLNFINKERYGPVTLTKKGRIEARKVHYRHRLLHEFLVHVLKVSPKTAANDACLIEHVISPETMKAILDCLAEGNYQIDSSLDLKQAQSCLLLENH